jgi:CheY-like chemotaxis protein
MTTGQAGPSGSADRRNKQFVLVVDSSIRDSVACGLLLQNFGYTVTTVRSPEEALELIAVAAPSLVVMDLVFSGMSGFELLGRIRQDRTLAVIPVIVQTSLPDITFEDRCRHEGCTLYLRKPVGPEVLYRAVQSTVERTPRRNLRISTYLRVSVGGVPMGAELITALSREGMFVKTLKPRTVGTRQKVTFVVEKRVISVEAEVLYVYAFGEGPNKEPGMGMMFTFIEARDQEFLGQFIQAQVAPAFPSGSDR